VITQQERQQAIERQIQRLQRRIDRLDQQSNRYGWIRVGIFFAALLVGLCVGFLVSWWLGVICFLLPMLPFGVVAYHQRRIDRSLVRHQIWSHLKTTELARMRRDWNAIPSTYTPEQQIEHPFETDLDITGKHSLHRLINTAVSAEGGERLRAWLLTTRPDLTTIQARQALMRELTPMSAFRTRLTMKATLATRNVATHLEGRRLLRWLDAQKKPANLKPLIAISHILTLLLLLLFLLNLFGLIPQYWIIALSASVIFVMTTKERRGNLFEDAYYLRDAFAQLNAVFTYLETYRYGRNLHLRQLCLPYFADPNNRPSLLLKKIQQVASGATLERNGMVWLLLNMLFPWDFYLALRFNRYKDQIAVHLPIWLEAWFELEALNSLATFAYLHPEYILPDVRAEVDETHSKPFHAQRLGHPLLEEEKKVVNDFTLQKIGEMVIITGSNMAGKSTFLRTMGINLCLAYTGAPVNATTFETALFRIFTCIKISDSVTEGYSYFYAEVRRLRALLDELERPNENMPIFFLIDEIFRGTNNRERRIGSEAYIEALSGKNCLGLLSTHDLELVKLAELLPQIENYHFREEVIDGQMIFDFILRYGPCPTTNALKIMQLEGLPVKIANEEALPNKN
jgi:ABC-type multidrug transport system fused ATPase/permease subunit